MNQQHHQTTAIFFLQILHLIGKHDANVNKQLTQYVILLNSVQLSVIADETKDLGKTDSLYAEVVLHGT